MAEERKEMVRLMNEIMEGWQEMEGKDEVVCVVDPPHSLGGKSEGCRLHSCMASVMNIVM